jgi:hypothetical protein
MKYLTALAASVFITKHFAYQVTSQIPATMATRLATGTVAALQLASTAQIGTLW